MIKIKSPEEIELIRESALIVSKTLGMLAKVIQPGVTTLKLDQLAEEFIYGMVKCAEKFEEGRSKNLRINTFGVLLGKIHTDSYSPIITESVMAFLSHLYPVEKVGTKLDEGYGKCFVLLSVCLKALTTVLVPFQGDSVEEDKRKELEKNRFYIPEKTFEKCKNTIVEWATPAKDVVKINKEMWLIINNYL